MEVDFNMNCFKYQQKSEINNFYNNTFERGAIPLINKLTRVPTKTATIIDNILVILFFDTTLIKAIVKVAFRIISQYFRP